MTLSVCCLTRDQPSMVAAMLALFRPIADDVVVAVDSCVDPATLGPLVDVVDTLLRFDYSGTPEQARPWLVAQCEHDDVLMVDGDEVPSAALLAALPELVADNGADQFRIARRWCFPDERHWLAERPWWPDFQRRLVRRGPDLDFDVGFHGGVRAATPSRHVMEPLYHLACVVKTFTERRRDARRYEAERPGMMAVGGGPMNMILFGPEHFATLRPEATPDEDLAMLRAVLDATATTSRNVPDIPVVPATDIAAHVPPDPLAEQGYRAGLTVVEADLRTDPGNGTMVLVAVTNLGATPIPHDDSRGVQVRLCTRLLDGDHAVLGAGRLRTPLPCDVPPGETRVAEAMVEIPDHPGRYTLEVDLLNERVALVRLRRHERAGRGDALGPLHPLSGARDTFARMKVSQRHRTTTRWAQVRGPRRVLSRHPRRGHRPPLLVGFCLHDRRLQRRRSQRAAHQRDR